MCYNPLRGQDLCNGVHKVVSQFVLLHHIAAVATVVHIWLYCLAHAHKQLAVRPKICE